MFKCIADLITLYNEFALNTSWGDSPREFYSKHSTSTSPTIEEVFDLARNAELAAARDASSNDDLTDDDLIIIHRVAKWRSETQQTDRCIAQVEDERAAARTQK